MIEKLEYLLSYNPDFSYSLAFLLLCVSALIAFYLYFLYRFTSRAAFYSRSYNVAMSGMCVATTAVVLAMQFSVIVSLGMVGALSIVRYRTAIKDPMDLFFLFWSVAEGIICGAQLPGLAALVCAGLTIFVLILMYIPTRKPPCLLVVNASEAAADEAILKCASEADKHLRVKCRNLSANGLEIIVEMRAAKQAELLGKIRAIDSVQRVSIVEYDGEVRF